ncbi:MAG: hypothetical protein DI603_18510 [Roseateles depolymerans]|uniref:Uncharacterized protein n=1 Tax=Roseateles depolymerans TaxID=76731 RepID=A0A2W5DHR1_9BURK|nr:MAG: hypothetical protein DI603_18510 [Roseateles depolymerans]
MAATARPLPDVSSLSPSTGSPKPRSRWAGLLSRWGSRQAPGAAEVDLGYESALPWVLADTDPAPGGEPAQAY